MGRSLRVAAEMGWGGACRGAVASGWSLQGWGEGWILQGRGEGRSLLEAVALGAGWGDRAPDPSPELTRTPHPRSLGTDSSGESQVACTPKAGQVCSGVPR